MKIGRVINSIWSTRKDEGLVGIKLLVVQLMERPGDDKGRIIVAGDMIGAGIGEKVLVSQGSSARRMGNLKNSSIDAVIVGIIDEGQNEISKNA